MNCNEVHQHLVDLVDRQLPGDVRSELVSHFNLCQACRFEYEIQVLAKDLVRTKLQRSSTPGHVHSLIVSSLQRAESTQSSSWLRQLAQQKAFVPSLAAGLALVTFAVLLNIPGMFIEDEFAHTSANDVINRSVQNFSLVRSGDLQPSMVACYPDILVGYFEQQGVDFAVSVLADDSCDWYGAVSDSYDGVKQAHIVYKRGDDVLYVLEVNKNIALVGSVFSLPSAAKKSLAETGWYTDPQHDNCNVILWTVNETLCAAVSTMNKDRMLALLSSQ